MNQRDISVQLGLIRPIRHICLHSEGYAIVFPSQNNALVRVTRKTFPDARFERGYTPDTNSSFYWIVREEDGVETRLLAYAEAERFEFTADAHARIQRRVAAAVARSEMAVSIVPTREIHVPDLLLPLDPYQQAFLEWVEGKDQFYLADEMGLGKSVSTMCAIHLKKAYPCIVGCPANARSQWANEYRKFFGDAIKVHVLNPTPTEEGSVVEWVRGPGRRVVIASYNSLAEWQRFLRYLPWKSVLLDEAQYIRKYSSRRAKEAIALADRIPVRGLLSGTPQEKDSRDWKPQLHALGALDQFRGYVALDGKASATDDLALNRRLIETVVMRRKTEDVEAQLPELREDWIALDVNEEALSRYLRAEREFQRTVNPVNPQMPMGTLRRLVGEAKVKPVLENIEPLWNTKATPIIFCYHHSVMDQIGAHLEDSGIHTVRYDGRMTPPQKENAKKRFQDGHGRAFIAQIGAAGVALNLQRADTVIFTELDWLPTTHSQAIARARRRGSQHAHTFVRYLWTPRTLDEDLRATLTERAVSIGLVVDGEAHGAKATFKHFQDRMRKQDRT